MGTYEPCRSAAVDGEERRAPSAFARNIMDVLERVEYRRCESGEDLEAVFRLRYKAFHTHGLLDTIAEQKLSDHLDDAANCYCFGVFMDGDLVSTVRLHHLTAATPLAPIMTVFGDRLLPRLARGQTFIDPSRLAIDPQMSALNRALPYVTLRLAVIANTYFNATSCISMIREEHTAFYHRIFGSVQVGEPRLYPPFTMPIYFYESVCAQNMAPTLERFPFFHSTATERRMLFAKARHGEPAPLTILPTAKYFSAAA
ncbi:N-acyl amino acid synthase FeeM domain-containing protein [Mesorhizobium sp. PUT5]|uniref:N-acyl amino acid synthase FeeM domain-containing protein n=1 Tax=Mesorhizobium sp. PUT5 TaxID=3454629 RepID=UPI003FA4B93A